MATAALCQENSRGLLTFFVNEFLVINMFPESPEKQLECV